MNLSLSHTSLISKILVLISYAFDWGFLNQKNISMEMGKLFPEDLIPHQQLRDPRLPDQSRPSSSSSSLRSLSVGSPEYSSLFDLVSASFVPDSTQEAPIERAIRPTSVSGPPHQLIMQAYSQQRNVYLPRPEIEDAAMTRAMLAVISSPSTSSSSYDPQNPTHRHQRSNQRTAFRAYDSALGPNLERRPSSYRQSNMKRMLALLRTIRPQMQEIRSSSTQLHHMISERKRREKLNESFEALRALLPPGIKVRRIVHGVVQISWKIILRRMLDNLNFSKAVSWHSNIEKIPRYKLRPNLN